MNKERMRDNESSSGSESDASILGDIPSLMRSSVGLRSNISPNIQSVRRFTSVERQALLQPPSGPNRGPRRPPNPVVSTTYTPFQVTMTNLGKYYDLLTKQLEEKQKYRLVCVEKELKLIRQAETAKMKYEMACLKIQHHEEFVKFTEEKQKEQIFKFD